MNRFPRSRDQLKAVPWAVLASVTAAGALREHIPVQHPLTDEPAVYYHTSVAITTSPLDSSSTSADGVMDYQWQGL